MTTLGLQNVNCRNCDQGSEQNIVLSTNACGSPDLDLRPPEMQRSTMHTWLQRCPYCGFCAPDLSEGECDKALVDSPGYRAILDNPRFPELARRFKARALPVGGSDREEAAHLHLCAAWACDDEGLEGPAIECRRAAAAGLEQQKPFEDSAPGLTWGAVLVDVLRRAGQFEQASSECDSLLTRRSAVAVLRQALELQRTLIAEGDRTSHSVEETVRRG